MLAGGLLMAGTDTTRNQLAAAVQVLCDHPDQWALLAEHPELAPGAVEETHALFADHLQHDARRRRGRRTGRVTIPAGTLVIANTAAANRDPAVYDEPERLDITRDGPPAMLTFGGGIHYCLGAHLAQTRTRRGPHRHHPPDAQSAPRRCGAMETDDWNHRAGHPAHRVRRRALTAITNGS